MSSVSATKGEGARRLGTALLVAILVTTGSYIRTRTADESTSADWLVILQVALCLLAGLAGIMLIRKHSTGGPAARLLIVYFVAVIVSAAFSPYFPLAAGYWVLLAGTSLLCIGLVSSSPTEASLRRLEYVILCTLMLMLLKDAIIDWFVLEPPEEELYRLGESATSANGMGLLAALAVCMSFITPATTSIRTFWRYAWRMLGITIVLLSRSRVGLIGLVLGLSMQAWFGRGRSADARSHLLFACLPCWAGSAVVLMALAFTMDVQPVTAMVEFVSRSEDSATLMSVTGRTEIWSYAIDRILEGARSILVGHGYGVSKLVLNENAAATFFAYHAHNTVLEALLATGLLGALPLLCLIAYGCKWVVRFSQIRSAFSLEFTLRAMAVMTIILSSTMTESDLANKLGPITIIFLFYLLALDRQECFRKTEYEQ